MIFSKKATSIIEAMVVMLIVVSGVVGMFNVFASSQKLSTSTTHKIQAIQIAREGIEAVKNIRDTNWILYGADSKNCWNVDNYNSSCVGTNGTTHDIAKNNNTNAYKLYRDSSDRWRLDMESSNSDYSDPTFRSTFEVFTDTQGFYTQSGTINVSKFKITPLFTREIKIQYFKEDGSVGNSNQPKMQVTSLVQWSDSSRKSGNHKVEFSVMLNNWKK